MQSKQATGSARYAPTSYGGAAAVPARNCAAEASLKLPADLAPPRPPGNSLPLRRRCCNGHYAAAAPSTAPSRILLPACVEGTALAMAATAIASALYEALLVLQLRYVLNSPFVPTALFLEEIYSLCMYSIRFQFRKPLTLIICF